MRTGPSPSEAKPAHASRRAVVGIANERGIEEFARALRDKREQKALPESGAEAALPAATTLPMQLPMQAPAADAQPPASPDPALAAAMPAVRTPELLTVAIAPASMASVDPPNRPAHLDLSPALAPGSDAARTFEVSLTGSGGVPLTLRAVPPPEAAGQARTAAGWTLSITASPLNLAALRRNTGRLDARLRSRALSDEPVRIENDEPPP